MSREVGQVSIRIRPDARGFAKDANRDLDAQSKQIKKIEVQLKPDFAGFRALVAKELKNIQATMNTSPIYWLRVPLKVQSLNKSDISAYSQKVNQMIAQEKAKPIRVPVELGNAGKVNIWAELDQRSLGRVHAQIVAFTKRISPQRVIYRTMMDPLSSVRTNRALNTIARPRTMSMGIDNKGLSAAMAMLNRMSGMRLLGGVGREFRDLIANLDLAVPKMMGLTAATALLGGGMIQATFGVLTLSRALAQMAGAGLALPGILGGMAIGIGATVAVFQDFNKQLPQVQKDLAALQDQMSDTFWAKAKAPIQEFIDTLLPQFSSGLIKTSDALGGFFAALSGSLKDELDGSLDGMFAGLNSSIEIFSGHTDSVAQVIRILGETGAEYLPRMAQWFGDLVDRFAAFLDEADRTGKLQEFIETGITRMQEFGRAVSETFKFFGHLATAADNVNPDTSALEEWGNTFERLNAIVGSAEFQEKLTGFLGAVDQMFRNIAAGSGAEFGEMFSGLADTLTEKLPGLGTAIGVFAGGFAELMGSEKVQTSFGDMLDDFSTAFTSLGETMPKLETKVAGVMDVLGAMSVAFAGLAETALTTFGPTIDAVLASMSTLTPLLTALATDVMTSLAPVFTVLSENITALTPVFADIITKVQELWNIIAPILVPILTVLAKILGGAVKGAFEGISLVLSGVIQTFEGIKTTLSGLWDVISGIFTGDGDKIKNGFKKIFGGLWGIIQGVFKTVVGGVWTWMNVTLIGAIRSGAVKLLASLKGAATKGFNGFLNAMKAAWTGIKNFFIAMPGNIARFLTNAGKWLLNAGSKVLNGLKNGLVTGWKAVGSWLRSVPGKIKGFFGSAKNWLMNAATAIMNGFLDGLEGAWNKVKDWFGDLTDKIPDWKGPRDRDKVLLTPAGQLIMQGFVKGLSSQYGKVREFFIGVTKNIPKILNEEVKKPAVMTAARFMMQNMLKGLRSEFKEIRKAFSEISSLGTDAFRESMSQISESANSILTERSKRTFDKQREALDAQIAKLEESRAAALEAQVKRYENAGANKDWLDKWQKQQEAANQKWLDNWRKTQEQALDLREAKSNHYLQQWADWFKHMEELVDQYADKWDDVQKEIEETLKEVYESAKKMGEQVKQSVLDLGDIFSMTGKGGQLSFDSILSGMKDAVKQAQAWRLTMTRLRDLGLNDNMMQQLYSAGAEKGQAAADAILKAGATGIAQLNAQQVELAKTAEYMGIEVYNEQYALGMNMAKGIIDGLKAQQGELEKTMRSLMQQMINAAKSVAKIKSPSRVFKEIGEFVGEGLVIGVESKHADADEAIERLVSARPSVAGAGSLMSTGASSQSNRTINYYAASGGASLSGEESLFAAMNRARSAF